MRKKLVIGVSPQAIQWESWTQTLGILIPRPVLFDCTTHTGEFPLINNLSLLAYSHPL